MIRVGLVDFDTSHVVVFTQRLNHVGVAKTDWIDGAHIVAGCPGDSKIMPERIPGYLEQLQSYGIKIVAKPIDLIGQIDAVMIESQQGSRHVERAIPFLEAGLPTFVDKPFAATVKEADTMISLAAKHKAPLMTCSALRYDPTIIDAVAKQKDLGKIVSAEVWGNAPLHPGNPGLLHYGIHGVEMIYTLLGRGCQFVQNLSTEQGEVAMGLWPGGRIGVVRGVREGQGGFGFTAHYEKGHRSAISEGSAFYTEMLKKIVGMFQTRVAPIDILESREIIEFISAAGLSSRKNCVRIPLSNHHAAPR
jgi:virulence factor